MHRITQTLVNAEVSVLRFFKPIDSPNVQENEKVTHLKIPQTVCLFKKDLNGEKFIDLNSI